MLFAIGTVFYRRYEDVVERYPVLVRKYGAIPDMGCVLVQIDTTEQLLQLAKDVNHEIILLNEETKEGHPFLEIYDSYRE